MYSIKAALWSVWPLSTSFCPSGRSNIREDRGTQVLHQEVLAVVFVFSKRKNGWETGKANQMDFLWRISWWFFIWKKWPFLFTWILFVQSISCKIVFSCCPNKTFSWNLSSLSSDPLDLPGDQQIQLLGQDIAWELQNRTELPSDLFLIPPKKRKKKTTHGNTSSSPKKSDLFRLLGRFLTQR